jgi:hypothetical protein
MNPRKPTRTATSARQSPRLPLQPVRREIWEAARDLVASGDGREVSAVLGNRYRLSEAVIDAVLVHEGMRHERVAAALRTGVVNALALARDVGDSEEAAA